MNANCPALTGGAFCLNAKLRISEIWWTVGIAVRGKPVQETRMDWDTVAVDFESDGGLRDIYVLDTTVADWQAAIDVLRNEVTGLIFNIGDETSELPIDATEIFYGARGEPIPVLNRSLYVPFGEGVLVCHFVGEYEIEFDLSPLDVNDETLPQLVNFMRLLGKATGKPVLLTMENAQDLQIMRFEPSMGDVIYTGPVWAR